MPYIHIAQKSIRASQVLLLSLESGGSRENAGKRRKFEENDCGEVPVTGMVV